MIEIPEFFAPDPVEAQKMAERTLQLAAAHETFLQAQADYDARTGFIGSVIGRVGLIKATREARQQGLTVMDGEVLVPQVVPLRYFNAMEDDF